MKHREPAGSPAPEGETLDEPVRTAILDAIRGVHYGQITVIVHDGRVVQIDRTERRRLPQATE